MTDFNLSEGREFYCHNKSCEAFNQAQGDCGAETKKNVQCIVCFKIMKKHKLAGDNLK